MTFEGKNEWALILGGSSGLGLASAKKLASEGMHLILVHRSRRTQAKELNETIDTLKETYNTKCLEYNIDATRTDKRTEVIHNISRSKYTIQIKVLLHSIAKGNLKPMVGERSLTSEDYRITIEAMGLSLYDWVKALLDQSLFVKDARILAFTSQGNQKPWTGYGAVSAAKTTLEAIVRNLAIELVPYEIKANCIQPGTVDTPSFQMIPGHERLREHSLKRNPYHRLTQPEDVANTVYLLCTDEAAFINGVILPVDGGEHLR